LPSELRPEAETWTGCTFEVHEVLDFARTQRFPLVALSGAGTQYMWTVFRKVSGPATRDPRDMQLVAVTASNGPATKLPARGAGAVASLWIDRMPEDGDLSRFPVFFGDHKEYGGFLSTISDSGGCQMNVQLPEGIQPGPVAVRLGYEDGPFGAAHTIEVEPGPALDPKIVDVTDAINLTSKNRAETGGLKVVIRDVADPGSVSFSFGGVPARDVLFERRDPITLAYEFTVPLPRGVKPGAAKLGVRLGSTELAPLAIEIA
jgi:hypothetical protein